MRFILFLLLSIFIISTLLIGNILYEDDLEDGELRDIYNLTSNISWDNSYNYTLEKPTNKEDIIITRMLNIIYRFVDFIGFSSVETVKTGIEFGYENPQYNYQYAFQFFYWLIILMIVSALVPLFIPVIAIITILGMGLHRLFKYFKGRNKNEICS